MSLVRQFSSKSVGDKLTSTEANDLDTNVTNALDKRSGQTDTLQSVVTCSSSGRIIPTYLAGVDADHTYALSDGVGIIVAPTLTANRTYTLSTTGATAGDSVLILNTSTSYDVTVKVSSTTLLVIGSGNTGTNQSRWGEFVYTGSTWILLRSSYGAQQQRQVFTSNGTYTVPADCYKLMVVGLGGGGGGAGAAAADTSTSNRACGGGGGGGAMVSTVWVDTSPGATFSVACGGGGGGGTGGVAGTDGSSTTFGTAISFRGGQGGTAPVSANTPAYQYAPGGTCIQTGTKRPIFSGATKSSQYLACTPSEGGWGAAYATDNAASAGCHAHVAATTGGSGTTNPGAAGSNGTVSGSYNPGGGGGGGGASAFGDGGAGGNGGNGNSSGTGAAGTSGAAGGAGAGGGGAGAAGQGSSAGGANSAVGGAGGNGALVVIPIR